MERDTVLIVDDDPDLRELIAIEVGSFGFVTVEAGNGLEALPLVEHHRARLRAVLLDYFMPGLAPVACAREIRARLDPGVPVVLVSAAVDIAERASELGLTRFLAKPFDISELRDVIGDDGAAP